MVIVNAGGFLYAARDRSTSFAGSGGSSAGLATTSAGAGATSAGSGRVISDPATRAATPRMTSRPTTAAR